MSGEAPTEPPPPYDPSWATTTPEAPQDIRVGIPGVGPQEIFPSAPSAPSAGESPTNMEPSTVPPYPPASSDVGNLGPMYPPPPPPQAPLSNDSGPGYPPPAKNGVPYPPPQGVDNPGYPPPGFSGPAYPPPDMSMNCGPSYPPTTGDSGFPPTPTGQYIPMGPVDPMPPASPATETTYTYGGVAVTLVEPEQFPQEIIHWGSFGNLESQKGGASDDKSTGQSCRAFCGTIAYGGVFACAGVLIWKTLGPYSPTELAIILSAVFLAVGYILVLIEGYCSNTSDYVSNVSTPEEMIEHIDSQRKKAPTITWSVSCYHYETRIEHYTTTDSQGNTVHNTRTRRERVTTYTGSRSFHFHECVDASGSISSFVQGSVTRIDFCKAYGFSDSYSHSEYLTQKVTFYDSNRHRDKHMDTDETIDIDGHEGHMSVNTRKELGCMQWHYFCCWTMLFLTCPYRIWYKSHTLKRKFVFLKVLKVRV